MVALLAPRKKTLGSYVRPYWRSLAVGGFFLVLTNVADKSIPWLLQHAIDSIVGTFYSQVLFANWELEAHRLAERGEPINSDSLSALYMGILRDFYADDIDHLDKYKVTWARIPHFFRSPYYVYQYATCFASSAMLLSQLEQDREGTVGRYLELLRSGGSDFPMEQLRSAGVDLDKPEAVQATVDQLDRLVDRLSSEIDAIGS